MVPVHSGDTIGPGLMTKIRRDVEMTPVEFARMLEA